jgi:hypothetical protein
MALPQVDGRYRATVLLKRCPIIVGVYDTGEWGSGAVSGAMGEALS